MGRDDTKRKLLDSKVIAVLRANDYRDAWDLLIAYSSAGVKAIEITTSCPDWETLLKRARGYITDDSTVGLGTVTSSETVKIAVDCGAEFIVSPFISSEVISTALEFDASVIPGALTPSEIASAYKLGADMVKVFPVSNVGGPAYIKALLAPMPDWELIPTGGVNRENAFDYFRAGAVAVGLGSNLAPKDALLSRNWDAVTRSVEEFLKNLNTRLEGEL